MAKNHKNRNIINQSYGLFGFSTSMINNNLSLLCAKHLGTIYINIWCKENKNMKSYVIVLCFIIGQYIADAAPRINIPPQGSGGKPFKAPMILYIVGGVLWTLVFLGLFCCIRVLREECKGRAERYENKQK